MRGADSGGAVRVGLGGEAFQKVNDGISFWREGERSDCSEFKALQAMQVKEPKIKSISSNLPSFHGLISPSHHLTQHRHNPQRFSYITRLPFFLAPS
jgi:hypothetical protein